ncbi:exodeoxyribonuclease VIII [Escherichia coli]|uniref:RecE family exodeoxyribonuclease n=1 Tax=Escherichia coli TaxID=562 RepID=UPI00128B96ED|nr:RecE family exodeoxyribonuclease [Escherichia coli]MPU29089.1 exodeoxyribonuclease VIII [Escherichia coli]MPU39504.1 exodeoxyribonuclease VIII [Escherichia coli]
MEFFYVVKATQKSGKPDAVVWFTAKTEARANLRLDVELEDANIETGRGKDYQKPIRTDFPVFNDLPEESTVDLTWCERYELAEDMRTWQLKPGSKPDDAFHNESTPAAAADATALTDENAVTTTQETEKQAVDLFAYGKFPYEKKVLGTWLYGLFDTLTTEQLQEITRVELDMDETYAQNVLLAARDFKTRPIEHVFPETLADLFTATKSIWPVDGKAPMLNDLITFFAEWIKTHQSDRVSRDDVTAKWFAKHNKATLDKQPVTRTDVGTNAGGGNKTDRNPELTHTLDSLDIEIALATLPMDFNIYDIPGGVYRRAKEIVSKKESPFKEWSAALRKRAGILDYSRAAIFALIRECHPEHYQYPGRLSGYINANLTESNHEKPSDETLKAARHNPAQSWDKEISDTLAAERGEFVDGISDPEDPKWVREDLTPPKQPEITNVGGGIFSVENLMANSKLYGNKSETTSNGQMETTEQPQAENSAALPAGEGTVEDDSQADTVTETVCTGCGAIGGGHCPDCGAVMGDATYAAMEADLKEEADTLEHDSNKQETPTAEAPIPADDTAQELVPMETASEPEDLQAEPATEYPAFFEPGRYEGLPNEVYHAANGISSTQVKDARVSLMYFNARHVEKTITKERSPVLDMGNLVHALALQPEQLDAEFSVEPEIPEGAFTTTATIRAFIDEYNASLPAQLSADDIKALLEKYNATLPPQVPLGTSLEETGQSYMALPAEFQRIEEGKKQTATAMKACIKEYNATLAPQVKTSGSRDALLEQLAVINPDLVAQEAQKPQPLKVSGTKADLIQAVKAVNPDAVFADELVDAWRENPEGKVLVTRQQLSTALNIQKALLQHPTAGKLLTHPNRAVEVSYFGFDDETGLEVRVRPDLEIDLDGVRIGADLKTISMWNIKQEGLRAKLHREIIDRDYHLSAAMYCETAALDQFFWIFVNKDENYHWIAIIEASAELLELGMLEYRKAMRAIATGFDTGEWPAPITADYTDELNDFDMRRLEALRLA